MFVGTEIITLEEFIRFPDGHEHVGIHFMTVHVPKKFFAGKDSTLLVAYDHTPALQVQKVLDEMRGFLCVTYNYTGYPMVRVLREKIQAKELGKITNIIIEMPQEGFSRYTLEHTAGMANEGLSDPYHIIRFGNTFA